MNLAVHGMEGDIREANTFYEDVHTLYGRCDFVMANPPFNVDMVDAEKVKDDRRLSFGRPGVNSIELRVLRSQGIAATSNGRPVDQDVDATG